MFELAGLKKAKMAATTVMDLETKLAEKQLDKEKTRDLVSLYNMLEIKALPEVMPDFNWAGYLKEAGLDTQEKMGVLMIDYLKALNGIITSTDVDTWKTYLKWSVIHAKASALNASMEQQNFEFSARNFRAPKSNGPCGEERFQR